MEEVKNFNSSATPVNFFGQTLNKNLATERICELRSRPLTENQQRLDHVHIQTRSLIQQPTGGTEYTFRSSRTCRIAQSAFDHACKHLLERLQLRARLSTRRQSTRARQCLQQPRRRCESHAKSRYLRSAPVVLPPCIRSTTHRAFSCGAQCRGAWRAPL